jgi:protein-tyrosine-phosphatase
MRHILFICTANQCRSPMAAGLFKQQIARLSQAEQWQVASAGTWAVPDRPATLLARTAMAEKAIDLSGHLSQLLDGELLRDADVILVMTHHHLEAICVEFPEVAGKTYQLSQLIGQLFDIDDPVQGTIDDYRRCATEMQRLLTEGYTRLTELADRGAATRTVRPNFAAG